MIAQPLLLQIGLSYKFIQLKLNLGHRIRYKPTMSYVPYLRWLRAEAGFHRSGGVIVRVGPGPQLGLQPEERVVEWLGDSERSAAIRNIHLHVMICRIRLCGLASGQYLSSLCKIWGAGPHLDKISSLPSYESDGDVNQESQKMLYSTRNSRYD